MTIHATIAEWLWLIFAVSTVSLKLVLLDFTRQHYRRSLTAASSVQFVIRALYLHTWHMLGINVTVFLCAVWVLFLRAPMGLIILGIILSLLLTAHAWAVLRFWYHLGQGDYDGEVINNDT